MESRNRYPIFIVIAASLLASADAQAQWAPCSSGSTTCTNQLVGIGTTSPVRNLVVSGNGTSVLQLSANGTGATCCDGFQVQQVGSNTHLINEQGGFITFWTGSQRRMTLDSNGRLGIGTTTPSAPYVLDVQGPAHVVSDAWPYGIVASASTGDPNQITVGINASAFRPGGTGVLTGGYGISAFGGGTGGVGVYSGGSDPNTIGVYGYSTGGGGVGVWGYSNKGGIGVFGKSAPVGNPGAYAGSFDGDVKITGSLSKGGGSFKIDHPLEPASKYLYHSFVESPDMKNIYDGIAVLDGNGQAVVQLPDWFEALNQDFRYQLTCLHGYAPVYVDQEITGNSFKIAGGKPGLKVSWQVTGIRHDAWANAHRIPVEEEKPKGEQGLYLYPKEQGQPEALGIDWEITRQLEQRTHQQLQ